MRAFVVLADPVPSLGPHRGHAAADLENNLSLSQRGYGVADAGWKTTLTGCDGGQTRHFYTSSAAQTSYSNIPQDDPAKTMTLGRCQDAVIQNCTAAGDVYESNSAIYDTHHSTQGVTLINNQALGGQGWAGSFRGRDVIVDGITVPSSSPTSRGINYFTEYDSGDADDDLYLNGTLKEDFTSGTLRNVDVHCTELPLRVSVATLQVQGANTFTVANDHCLIESTVADTMINGNITMLATASDKSDRGVFTFESANDKADSAIGMNRVIIAAGVLVNVNASAASGEGIAIFRFVELWDQVKIDGTLKVRLPAGAAIATGPGSYTFGAGGKLLYKIGGQPWVTEP